MSRGFHQLEGVQVRVRLEHGISGCSKLTGILVPEIYYLDRALRKFTAIGLICLLAFNWYGYRLFIHYLETRSSMALQEKVDENEYNERELVELRVPLNLPYLSGLQQFQSFEGETTINGNHYRYVKRKVEKGTLVLVCIANQEKDKIAKAGSDYFKQVNDLPAEKKAKNNHKVVKSLLTEFCSIEANYSGPYTTNFKREFSLYLQQFSSLKPATPTQPPNSNCV